MAPTNTFACGASPLSPVSGKVDPMVNVALLATFEAMPGKEDETAAFLKSALPMVEAEPATTAWFGIQLGPSTFGIFDAFPDDDGRQAHLTGKVAEALFAKAPELFSAEPTIQMIDVLASKLPGTN
jgi:quinol monooxygenase YgiN